MSSDYGIVSNVQVKTFNRMQKTFGEFWFYYFKALLMIKDILDVLHTEFKTELPDIEYAEGQTNELKDKCSKNRQVKYGFLWNNIDFPKMDD